MIDLPDYRSVTANVTGGQMREVCNTGYDGWARKEKRGEWTSPRSKPASECWMVVFTDGSLGGARNGDSCGLHPLSDGTSGGCAGSVSREAGSHSPGSHKRRLDRCRYLHRADTACGASDGSHGDEP
jgi:hypothetical protein